MASPDSLGLLTANAAFLSALLYLRYRHVAGARRAREDEAEDERLTTWVIELRAAGVAQQDDPAVGSILHRYAELRGQGRHRASQLRPATMTGQA